MEQRIVSIDNKRWALLLLQTTTSHLRNISIAIGMSLQIWRTHARTHIHARACACGCVCVASLTAIVNYYYRTKIIQIYVVHTILWFSGSSGTMICCTLQFFRFPFSSNMLNVPAETLYDYYIFYYVLFRRYHQQKCRFDFYREDRDVSFLTEIKIRRRWKVALYLVH